MNTARLRIRPLTDSDAPFILALLLDPDFIRFIGDRGVHDLDQARAYVERMRRSIEVSGFGMQVMELPDGTAIGLCGLLSRDWLPELDVGYALLPAFRGAGYAREATAAMLDEARRMKRTVVLAIVSPDNVRSRKLLESLHFRDDGEVTVPTDTTPICRYRLDFQ